MYFANLKTSLLLCGTTPPPPPVLWDADLHQLEHLPFVSETSDFTGNRNFIILYFYVNPVSSSNSSYHVLIQNVLIETLILERPTFLIKRFLFIFSTEFMYILCMLCTFFNVTSDTEYRVLWVDRLTMHVKWLDYRWVDYWYWLLCW